MPFDPQQVSNTPTPVAATDSSATSATPAPDSTPAPPPAVSPDASQVSPAPAASGDGSRINFGQNPNRSVKPDQTMVSNAPAQPQPDLSQHPAVKHASVVRSVAETLAGGPSVSVRIDDNGNRVVTKTPLSTKHIALALALEAIQGSLSGLTYGRGKGAGAAGLGAMEQQIAQRQQQQKSQNQEAKEDFDNRAKALADKAAAYASNLRTRAMAQEVGMRDEQSHKDWIASHAATAQYFRDKAADAIIRDNVRESELTPEFIREVIEKGWIAIPTAYVPRFDAQGNHFSPDGVPMHDNLYMVVDGSKIPFPADVVQKAQSWNLPGVSNRNGDPIRSLEGADIKVAAVVDMSNKVAVLDQEQRDLQDYYSYLTSKGVNGPDGKPLEAPNLKQVVRQNPGLISDLTGRWANIYAGSPSAALKAMKDDSPSKGSIAALYGGRQLLDKYDVLKDSDKKAAEKRAEGDEEVATQKKLIPVRAATAGAEEAARVAANPQNSDAALTTPDALGFKPNVPGGLKEYNKRFATFKKNADELTKTEGTYAQFQAISKDIAAGRFSGADSVVGLFDAIGISATPLAGKGFRVNQNTIAEHEHARGWAGALQQKLLSAKAGDVITPQQLLDYANIAAQARQSQYINLVNQVHNAGLNADFVLPTGNGQTIDKSTAGIFLQLSGNDFAKAAVAMKAKGWIIP